LRGDDDREAASIVVHHAWRQWRNFPRSPKHFRPFASPADEGIRSFTILTTTPNELCAEFYNRMPFVLTPDVWPDEVPAAAPQLKALLAPFAFDEIICWPVSARV
jgi:putative SOS response-associated peptidase YedK